LVYFIEKHKVFVLGYVVFIDKQEPVDPLNSN